MVDLNANHRLGHERKELISLRVFFNLFIFSWMIFTLQDCGGFCHTSTRISRQYVYVPSLLNLPLTSHPHPNPQGFRRRGVWAWAAKVWNLAISHQQLIRQRGREGKAMWLGEASRCMWIKGTEQIWGAERTPSEWWKHKACEASPGSAPTEPPYTRRGYS